MIKNLKKIIVLSSLLITSTLLAEVKEIVVSKQYGISYLSLIVLEEQKLIEKYAKEDGLGDIKVNWATFGGGSIANDALLSGNAHIVGGGNGPFIRLWDKTEGKVKALAALNESPIVFVSNNPNVKSLKDLTEKDKIAVPSVKVSVQSLLLQIAAAKEFGIKSYDKFDNLTVSLKNPDAYAAITSGNSPVTGHISLDPYPTLELEKPNIHKVFDSFTLLGGAHTTNLIWATENFYKENPKLSKAVVKALDEANNWIVNNHDEAVKLYLASYKSDESPELISKVLKNSITFNTKPKENITQFSDFLYDVGAIKKKPTSWEELFFDSIK
ncbi:ABC transporter substrate-binding protein [Aliarcobacter cibarius]|uniref:ABC transporter substrate-binding protein n=1 Tax=Aliarcobacter cibarius TaxID=255507 RepID=A0ABY2V373_9BACT|nr:ABC transporter substrate-binding protein [Aliarcobacter cibarius]TLS97823.1 ABC transporter substrate-binding protein [Aliarcobacter cibarius]TLS98630.1 ABC transporter substrate-binding protein [Aliarcobacter cibarius]